MNANVAHFATDAMSESCFSYLATCYPCFSAVWCWAGSLSFLLKDIFLLLENNAVQIAECRPKKKQNSEWKYAKIIIIIFVIFV